MAMFRKLLITEFDANKLFLILALVGNILFFIFLGLRESSVKSFMAGSLNVYLFLLLISGVWSSEQKRLRLYTQLPVTVTEVFLATWIHIHFWLVMHVCFWLLYGVVFDPQFSILQVAEIVSAAMGIASFVTLIGIAIDLWAFKPAYVRWMYIGGLLFLMAVAVQLDMSIGIIGTEEGFQVLPFGLLGEGRSGLIISIIVLALLLFADFLVYKNSDHYLR
jgi:hypothetical protein|tara:strand:+ start:20181 stop:20840 length:660 start_codon:yes stop_codon:yes gene_type:complete